MLKASFAVTPDPVDKPHKKHRIPDPMFLGTTVENAHGQTRPNADGERFIYYCRCLVGDYIEPENGVHINAAPQKKGWVAYDSTVNKQNDPLLFSIYDADQVYPQYLIKYMYTN